ncbi:MAG TPA: 30S ribosomal protein S12 methylthiotransferase RimO [Bacteroidales bacterium]|nr:30S ribosomal protein S12 methylthiotransferase RimO [Bacteroidales bacterium]HRZ20583.1 30S ribosomal protein S12 methylthiotransferase RimO [Bacteroidales bacterium]
MRTKRPDKTLRMITLGCSKNTVDSEKLLKQFERNGFSILKDPSVQKASVIVINTCGFIHDAREESVDTILQCIQEKKNGNAEKVLVIGCLAQRYREELMEEIPEADGVFGVDDAPAILDSLGGNYKEELVGERILTTPAHYAYLKISEGCSRECSFCAIPLIRGKHISRPEEEILMEARNLVGGGVKELILIAQDLTYYGADLYKKRTLPRLIEKLAGIEGLEWIRLHYAYPAGFPADLLRVIHQFPNVCKYIDLPVQHISDRILSSMKRGISSAQTLDLLDTIRKQVPGIAVRTSLIVGYPGETEREFMELLEFVKQYRFDRLGIFTYSHEENTSAYGFKDNIPDKIKQEYANEIMRVQEEISYELNQNKLNKIINVLVDREDSIYYIGRTEHDSPDIDNEVLINKERSVCIPGYFYPVRINGIESFDIFGDVV